MTDIITLYLWCDRKKSNAIRVCDMDITL